MQTANNTSTNISNEDTLLENKSGSNICLKTHPENENDSNVYMRTQPWKDDKVFLNHLNICFRNNANDHQDCYMINDSSKTANPEDKQPTLLNEGQQYCQAKH